MQRKSYSILCASLALLTFCACQKEGRGPAPEPLQPSGKSVASASEKPKEQLAKPPPHTPPAPKEAPVPVAAPAPTAENAAFDIQQLGDLSVPSMADLKAQYADKITPERAEVEFKKLKGEILGQN